jgi:hypothetical protein
MKPTNRCQICGKSTQGSPLCEDCEGEVLEKQKGSRIVLSGIVGVILAGAVYVVWNEYSEKQSQVDSTIVTGAFGNFFSMGTGAIRSPFIFAPVLLILIVLAFYWGVRITK